MSITLLQLRTESRYRADMVNSDFVTDAELNTYINKSIAELHDIMVQAYGADYKISTATFDTVASQDAYAFSTIITANDFYKLQGIDIRLSSGSTWTTIRPFNFNERNRFQRYGVWDNLGLTNVRYRLVGSDLILAPTPTNSYPVKVWYIPVATQLVLDTDTFDDLNQWSEYVIVDAVMKMLMKQETDVTILMAEKIALKRRIEEVAQNRDAGKSESISDIYVEDEFLYY